MSEINSNPTADGYFMPAEFALHKGCIMIWPARPGSWPYEAKTAKKAFTDVIEAISKSEKVFVAAGEKVIEVAKAALAHLDNVEVFLCETDDAWARDVAPTFVVSKSDSSVRCINWEFNAWGGDFDGLYAKWDQDNAFAKIFADKYGYDYYDATPFVLEGGSIHSDGEGTIMVTESCLLSAGRNPALSKEEIAKMLCKYLGAKKVIWLPRGIYNDETNEHVDNICAFIKPGEVVLAWTDNKEDSQYQLSTSCMDVLKAETDAMGRTIVVHKLPIPDYPELVTAEDLAGYVFEEGEDVRAEGERLAASYVNFYFSNSAVILPAFGGKIAQSDDRAARLLAELCPDREVIQVPARDILVGGGNIHCITQQIPQIDKESE